MHRAWLSLWVVVAVTLAACGSKSQLRVKPPRPRDGGMDLSFEGGLERDGGDEAARADDGGADADAGPTITAECDRRDIYTSPRRNAVIVSNFTSSEPIERADFRVVTAAGVVLSYDTRQFVPNELEHTLDIAPNAEEDIRVTVWADTFTGVRAQCEYTIHSIVGPPVAICPEEQPLVTRIDAPLTILGDAFDDLGVTSIMWSVASAPPSSTVSLDPLDELQTVFQSDTRGDYTLRLRVADADGASDECDTQVRVTEPPTVMCPSGVVSGNARRPVTLSPSATDDFGVESTRWTLTSKPSASRLELGMPEGRTLTFTPDVVGTYTFEFTAVDTDGLTASCTITVNVLPSPPEAICPDTIRTTPLSTVTLRGSAVADRPITRYLWDLNGAPDGSAARQPAPRPGQEVSFIPDLAGEYTLRLTVTDSSGATGQCETTVLAVNAEGLRVELFWNPPDRSCDTRPGPTCDPTDVDLHLLGALEDGTGSNWFVTPDDCYFASCIGDLEWSSSGPRDNPRLDIDDVEGFGPENINIEAPTAGTYRIGVHLYSVDSGSAFSQAVATVNVYCGAGTLTPTRTFGPVVLRSTLTGSPDDNDFWRVADVTLGAGPCRITDLSRSGRPDVRPAVDRSR